MRWFEHVSTLLYPALAALILLSSSFTDCAQVTQVTQLEPVGLCVNVTLRCTAEPAEAVVWWTKDGINVSAAATIVTEVRDEDVLLRLVIDCTHASDEGTYSCHALDGDSLSTNLTVQAAPVFIMSEGSHVGLGGDAEVLCAFRGVPAPNITWSLLPGGVVVDSDTPRYSMTTSELVGSLVESHLVKSNITRRDNSTLECRAENVAGNATATVSILVIEPPRITAFSATVVGKSRIFVNWTVNNGNAQIELYRLQYRQVDASEWTDVDVSSRNSSSVITGLQPGTLYSVQLVATNAAGDSNIVTYGLPDDNRTLSTAEQDPMYQPSLTLKAATPESLTVSWSGPSAELAPYTQYYRLLRAGKDTATGSVVEVEVEYPSRLYVWRDLDAGRTYTMTVRACNRLVDLCGLWSDGVNGTTLLDKSAQPQQVTLHCQLYRQSPHLGTALVTWLPPDKTADLSHYTVSVTGKAEYYGKEGSLDHMFFGPDFKALPTDQTQAIFTVPPNTNYTANVCADSSRGRCMGSSSATCSLGAGLPASEHLPDYSWWRVRQDEQWVLLLQVDRVAERNGAVCCYRVVVVRLGADQQVSSLPSTDDITVSSYSQVQTGGSGAYLADMFEHDFVKTRYLTLGDGETLASTFSGSSSAPCATCRLAPPINNTSPSSTSSTPPARRRRAEHGHRRRRLVRESGGAGVLNAQDEQKRHGLDIEDGPLEQHGRYTAFVQFLVRRADGVLSVASTGYLPALSPAPSSIISDQAPTLAIVLGIICALSFCVLVLIVTLCALRHYGKEVSVSGAVRLMLESIRGHTLSGTPAPDLPPIGRGELVAAYQERHRDSDSGFRREFDCLPQCFHDRTTYASEALENSKKNRYPDIRAFDQTRVKLSQLNGVQSTEYINANYVWGYKERKKFICAQGPLDATIDDFWRMVWEQRCELMVMLTNLEEVGRNKCAKYWPEDGETTYGSINVSMSEEKSFSDYIQRVLNVSRPRPDGTVEIRRITHLHYLVWKDFMAPEHPTGLLRFIKRINQIYSLEMGPILVHCSAGVGRTGTLVAIDSLLQELDEEDEVTIFNAICDLRHQRNYLVQSLKQYVFVYRALMEMAQFGDTQIAADKLSGTYKTLIQPVRDRSRNKLDDEFRRLGDVLQERRSFVVGSAEENRQKNRCDYIVPYDANRVILAPVPNRPTDTYINASFIQGYDITETYVITQDPLKKTQADFWRMVVDLEVAVIIMLTELATPDSESSHKESAVIGGQDAAEAGDKEVSEASDKEVSEADSKDATEAEDDKCPRYWPRLDEETMFDHFCVKTVGENTPAGQKLTVYSITVTNTRTKDSISTQLLQFCDWPTGEATLPDSVGPLTQLMSQCTSLQEQSSAAASSTPPVVVHCSGGGFRSSTLVSLFILMRQMDTERFADVFQTVRKLRSQRQCMIQQLVQYDFLYRMLVEYAAGGTNSLSNGHTA